MSRKNSQFRSAGLFGPPPIYNCGACGRRTRETGHDESSVELCAFCYEEAGLENSYSDGAIERDEYLAVLHDLEVQYGRTSTSSIPSPTQPNRSTTMSKTTKPATTKLAIEDACSAPGCIAPPAKSSSYCAKHEGYDPHPKAPKKARPAPSEMPSNAKATAEAFRTMLTKAPKAAKAAKAPKAAVASNGLEVAPGETLDVMTRLYAKGWGNGSISRALGVRNQVAYGWGHGTISRRLPELYALLHLDAPAALARGRKPSADEVTGAIRAPSDAQASPRMNRKLDDPRQLVLALLNVVDGILGQM